MTKFVFEKDFDFRPEGDWRSIVEYKASEEPQTVTRECAVKAKAAGVGDYYKEPKGAKRKSPKTD